MGVERKTESEFKYRCVQMKRNRSGAISLGFSGVDDRLVAFAMVGVHHLTCRRTIIVTGVIPLGTYEAIHGDTIQDAWDEAHFSIELTRIDHLKTRAASISVA
ncbi:hypothetical protein BDR05DRAFT_1022452 [Suillus weaverae]|nr:hypothetical protein BDR05DRAFT_1022452 [Suillus weaverae]